MLLMVTDLTMIWINLFWLFSTIPWGCAFYPPEGLQGLLGPNPVLLMGEGQGTPWMSRQLIAGPLLMAVAAPQGANCTSGAILGFSILLKDTSAYFSPTLGEPGIWTNDLPITGPPALPTELQPPLLFWL